MITGSGDVQSRIEEKRGELKQAHIRNWRMKAEELRTIAAEMRSADARRLMLNAAINYERLADEADELSHPSHTEASCA